MAAHNGPSLEQADSSSDGMDIPLSDAPPLCTVLITPPLRSRVFRFSPICHPESSEGSAD